jgi:hypothetical protein
MNTKAPMVKMSLIWPDNSPYKTMEIHLGNFKLRVYEGDEHLTECLYDGECHVPIPKEAERVFRRHEIYLLTEKSNPEVISMLRKVFVDRDESDFKGKSLSRRTAKVALKKDKTICALLENKEFICLSELRGKKQKYK